MKVLGGQSLDALIERAVAEVFDETLLPRIHESTERERQREQAAASKEFKDENKSTKTSKEKRGATRRPVKKDLKAEPAAKTKPEGDIPEADKDNLNPKSMMAQLEKMDDENKPNISKEKMQVVFPSKEQVIRADVKHVLMMLNMMRSGKSLKKADTKRQLQDYYGTLNAGEKQALYATISGLTQILAAGVPGRSAVDPSYISLGISPKAPDEKSSDKKSDSDEAPVADRPADGIFKVAAADKPVKSVTSPSKEKKVDDTPIVVGEAADKTAVRRVFEAHKRG